jgi:hypothetical protein
VLPYKLSESMNALPKCGRITHVQSTRIKRVARQQYSRAAIVQRDARRLMPWNRQHVEHPAAEIDHATICRPPRDAKKRTNRGRVSANHYCIWPMDKLRIPSDVIAMRMAVRDNERNRLEVISSQPFTDESIDRRRNIDVTCTSIEQEGTVVPEDQIEKRLLEIGTRRLTKDKKIDIVALYTNLRRVSAVHSAGIPARCKLPGLERRTRHTLRGARSTTQRRRSEDGHRTEPPTNARREALIAINHDVQSPSTWPRWRAREGDSTTASAFAANPRRSRMGRDWKEGGPPNNAQTGIPIWSSGRRHQECLFQAWNGTPSTTIFFVGAKSLSRPKAFAERRSPTVRRPLALSARTSEDKIPFERWRSLFSRGATVRVRFSNYPQPWCPAPPFHSRSPPHAPLSQLMPRSPRTPGSPPRPRFLMSRSATTTPTTGKTSRFRGPAARATV